MLNACETGAMTVQSDIFTLPEKALFVSVILDVQIQGLKDRLFTYKVPEALLGSVFIGAQVIVPFGPRQLVPGYVIELLAHFEADYAIKEIQEVLEPEPLFDQDYIDFLAYIGKQYCSSLQEVIAAAIPACLTTKLKRVVKLGPQSSFQGEEIRADDAANLILSLLRDSAKGALSLNLLRQRFEQVGRKARPKLGLLQFQRALRDLVKAEVLLTEVEEEGSIAAKTATFLKSLPPDKLADAFPLAKTVKQRAVLEALRKIEVDDQASSSSCTISRLAEAAGVSRATVEKLVAAGLIIAYSEEVQRDSLSSLPQAFIDRAAKDNSLPLTAEQAHVFAVLENDLAERLKLSPEEALAQSVEPWLLHGVTGSGKTEVYLRLITEALKQGRSALFLVPEISLTPQLSGRLKSRFGRLVAVWHSAISAGERYDTWRRLRSGEVRVLLGARSAILAHLPDLGVIILDEEHDGSYKQSSPSPRYNARDVAIEKARRTGALVLFGSATPDIVSYQRAKLSNRILAMPNRVFLQAMPKVTLVDMRKEFADGKKAIFSPQLSRAIDQRLARQEQVVLLINRRGFANHVFCQLCGHVVKCKNCSVTLTLHRRLKKDEGSNSEKLEDKPPEGHLACHHCGFRASLKEECPSCSSPFLKESGLGTQKVEQEVHKRHPDARVVRLDSDVAARKGAYEKVLNQFSQGEADILIGTQMVAKGLDIERVTLVGVLTADAAFNLPDYRSTERGFQLLTQVAGRAGRGERVGEVILQTYAPELEALRLASKHDYYSFFGPELENRRDFEYPPFSQLIRIVVSGEDQLLVESVSDLLAEEISRLLEDDVPEDDVKLLGPVPCVIERIKGRFRYHLIIKNKGGAKVQEMITEYMRLRRFGPQVSVAVDVDALDMI
ncbi:MAG: primosomal protein N' [Candidatus Melainabacteria bacterium]|nr:primosomal protein N' [Candidatus Melainabacteria bacterium]